MLRRPADVVAGLALAARAVGAREAVVFLKGSFERPRRRSPARSPRRRSTAWPSSVRRGDDGYVTGEETALLEALEGRRPWPRAKPPLPAAVGLPRPADPRPERRDARPGAGGDRRPRGLPRERDRTLVTLWGDVRRPGVYEVRARHAATTRRRGARRRDGGDRPRVPRRLRRPSSRRVRSRRAPRPRVAPRRREPRSAPAPSSWSGPPPARWRWPSRWPRSSSARTAANARPARSAPRVSPASCARSRRAAPVPATCATSTTWAGSCPATATVPTAASRPPSPRRWRARFAEAVDAHVSGDSCPWPERRHPDPFAPGSPERAAVEAAVLEQLQ